MTTEPQSPLSEPDKLAATLAELEREREQRRAVGKWSNAVRPVLMAVPHDPPPLKWSDLRYVFDIKEDCNGKEAIQA
jgi:hypothetical protein